MDRRDFLRRTGFLTVSSALGGLAACGGSSSNESDVQSSASSSGSSDWKFPQSVASGDPVPDGVVLWTRVVPASADDITSAASAGDFTIRLVVTNTDNSTLLGSNTALAGTPVVSSSIPVYARFDHTVRNQVTGLSPATTYYYQFIAGEVRSKVGRFRTAPATDAEVGQLKLAFLSCQDWTVNHWAAYSLLAEESLDVIVHLGDYIYETVGESFQSGKTESRHTALTMPVGTQKTGTSAIYASDIADYRYLYKRYRSDARLQAVHERFPFISIWDDHEFSDDCWQDAETYDSGSYNSTTGAADNTHQTARRRGANQAWFEYMPANIQFDETTTSFANVKLYRDLKWGKLAHFIVTDERLYRADHIIPEAAVGTSIGSRYMVPLTTLASLEAQKMAAASATDSLAPVSMLGSTQRTWWKQTMSGSTSTWRLWCNEVSLLRMGLNGTNAIATLLALNSISTLASTITSVASSTGSIPLAAAVVAAITAGATQAVALAAASAMATASDPATAATSAGLTASQAAIAIAARAAASAASTSSAQIAAAAQTIAFGYIKPDIQLNGAASSFVTASGQATALSPYFAKFLLNCDQWDGYNAERKDLVAHLRDNAIGNVVALTGDLHAFFAGEVRDNYDAADGGKAVLVDLVGAGISSDSFFSYFSSATTGSALSSLVFQTLSIPVSGLGTLSVNFNLFDYTLARATPTLDQLAEQARRPVRAALAAASVAEASLDSYTESVLTALKASSAFNTDLLALASQLAGLNSNPWIKHVATDAQGFSLVTLTADKLVCEFRCVEKLVATSAPSLKQIASNTTITVPAGQASLTVS